MLQQWEAPLRFTAIKFLEFLLDVEFYHLCDTPPPSGSELSVAPDGLIDQNI